MDIDAADDDVFDDVRDRVDHPMRRLFEEYGSDNWLAFAVGFLGSVAARLLDLLPARAARHRDRRDVRGARPFSLGPIPLYEYASDPESQVILATAIIAGAFLLGAGFHWIRNWGGTASPSTSSTPSGPTPTTRCSGSTWTSTRTSRPAR